MNKRELERLAKTEFETPELEALRRRELARGPYERPRSAEIARMVFVACMSFAAASGMYSYTSGNLLAPLAMIGFAAIGAAVLLFTPDTL